MSKGLGIPVEVESVAVTIVRRRTVVVSSMDGDRRSVVSPLACQADRGTVSVVGSTDWAHAGD